MPRRARSLVGVALGSLLLAPLLATGWLASAHEAPKVGRISALEGRATVLRQGMDRPDSLAVDSALYRADTVQTAASSKARLSLEDDTVITMAS